VRQLSETTRKGGVPFFFKKQKTPRACRLPPYGRNKRRSKTQHKKKNFWKNKNFKEKNKNLVQVVCLRTAKRRRVVGLCRKLSNVNALVFANYKDIIYTHLVGG
jgi:hypothetical protein